MQNHDRLDAAESFTDIGHFHTLIRRPGGLGDNRSHQQWISGAHLQCSLCVLTYGR